MTMRSDAEEACTTTLGDDGKPTCSTRVKITAAHYEEAASNVGDDVAEQRKWLRNEAVAGCKTGCQCAQSVSGGYDKKHDAVSAQCRKSSNDVQTATHGLDLS